MQNAAATHTLFQLHISLDSSGTSKGKVKFTLEQAKKAQGGVDE